MRDPNVWISDSPGPGRPRALQRHDSRHRSRTPSARGCRLPGCVPLLRRVTIAPRDGRRPTCVDRRQRRRRRGDRRPDGLVTGRLGARRALPTSSPQPPHFGRSITVLKLVAAKCGNRCATRRRGRGLRGGVRKRRRSRPARSPRYPWSGIAGCDCPRDCPQRRPSQWWRDGRRLASPAWSDDGETDFVADCASVLAVQVSDVGTAAR